ncbi:Xaa-Pro peptidase family protein [Exiguobacterium sp. LL15]|uniref:M24 family metallopeptidase n=1 Tax=Exiguobacterium sp. LL15 TaxID=2950547 RepID=UPI00210979A4|nr:Xaa-Pro peptidase family protein [Exiguobacterium sp. LL15]MCQ4089554.1 Xaa-Pro peptidase family protein [Exiguobacterium sp. LL15]
MSERTNQISEFLKEQGIDLAVVTSKANVFYFSGVYAEPHERVMAVLVDVTGKHVLFCPALEASIVAASPWEGDVVTYEDHENPFDRLAELFATFEHSNNRIGIEGEHMTFSRYQELSSRLENAAILDIGESLQALRLKKTPEEIAILQEAATLADEAIEIGKQAIRPGITEIEVIAEIEYEMKKKGVREMSFDTLVLFGANSADPHGVPGERVIQEGDFVLFDLGVVWKGYCSDITRTFIYGEANEEQKKIYETVRQALEAATEASQIGTTLGALDKAARDVISNAGYGQYFTHRVGHGLGIEVHEFPSLASNNLLTAEAGIVYTLEPGIYVPGVGGVRIEDDIHLTAEGPVALTRTPKHLQSIPSS